MSAVGILGGTLAALAGLGTAEFLAHQRHLKDIPIRMHVSGTRGKSSVTRLLAAGMRGAGKSVAAKTTGTLARMILPDGRELPVFRPAGANIIEQTRIVSVASALKVDALVLECMALIPELHWICERKLVRATHGIITNARADHLDVMGPGEPDVARCLAGMIPVGGVLFTAEQRHLAILAEAAKDRRTRLVAVGPEDLAAVTDAEIRLFSYQEHRDNVALALKVIQDLGLDRQAALEGMWAASPDPGALTVCELDFFGRRIVFANAFAANDPESTEKIWRMMEARFPDVHRKIAVFNLRADRASRTQQLAADCSFWREADATVLMGNGGYLFARVAATLGVDTSRFIYADHERAEDVFETILQACGPSTLVVGMGNVAGLGLDLARFFFNRQILEAPA